MAEPNTNPDQLDALDNSGVRLAMQVVVLKSREASRRSACSDCRWVSGRGRGLVPAVPVLVGSHHPERTRCGGSRGGRKVC
jgi:hypothetical protein